MLCLQWIIPKNQVSIWTIAVLCLYITYSVKTWFFKKSLFMGILYSNVCMYIFFKALVRLNFYEFSEIISFFLNVICLSTLESLNEKASTQFKSFSKNYEKCILTFLKMKAYFLAIGDWIAENKHIINIMKHYNNSNYSLFHNSLPIFSVHWRTVGNYKMN